eukprot:2381379-Prymnesium_polylepis.1
MASTMRSMPGRDAQRQRTTLSLVTLRTILPSQCLYFITYRVCGRTAHRHRNSRRGPRSTWARGIGY